MSGDGFFRSRWVSAPAALTELEPAGLAPGFSGSGVHCGLKGGGGTDLGIVMATTAEITSALLLTRNASAAAPIRLCRQGCDQAAIRAAVVTGSSFMASAARLVAARRGLRLPIASRKSARSLAVA